MIIARGIIEDLLPLYVAGEASADSQRAVEEALRDDHDLARLAQALRSDSVPGVAGRTPADGGKLALGRAKAILRVRTWLFALALFLTLLPLSVAGNSSGVQFWLIRDAPAAGTAIWTAAAALWMGYAWVRRRLRVTGL